MSQAYLERETERASGAPGTYGGPPHYQPQLDGIRGIAILAVLFSHAGYMLIPPTDHIARSRYVLDVLVPGWGGVDIFFALSGFLITGILLKGRERAGYFTSFYARRFLRIFPIYYLFLFCSLLLCTQVPWLRDQIRGSRAHLPITNSAKLSFFLYLQNFPVFWPTVSGGLTGLWGAYWSLAVEEQFYLIWPALVRFLRTGWMYGLCLAGVLAGPIIRSQVSHLTGDSLGLLQFPVTRLDGLFAGAALAFYRHRKGRPLPVSWASFWLAAGLAILAFIALFHENELTGPSFYIGRFGISGFALTAAGLLGLSQHEVPVVGRLLKSAPLRFLGKYSYGIYIYHLSVVLFFARFLKKFAPAPSSRLALPFGLGYGTCAILISVAIAVLSYRYIEAPILSLKRYFPSPAGAA